MKRLGEIEPADPNLLPGCVIEEAGASYARFRIEPIEPGHASSIANPIRRALLNGIPGWGITLVKIDGVVDELENVPHARDRTLDILLNLKKTKFRPVVPVKDDVAAAFLRVSGKCEALSGDIDAGGAFEIANPDNYVTALGSPDARLDVEMELERGLGYRLADMGKAEPGVLPVDSLLGPSVNASFEVDVYRVGARTDMERVVFHVETDETISPLDAFRKATALLSAQFSAISACAPKTGMGSLGAHGDAMDATIETLEFSNRALNALKTGEIHTVRDLLATRRQTLKEMKGIGERSYKEIAFKIDAINAELKETE